MKVKGLRRLEEEQIHGGDRGRCRAAGGWVRPKESMPLARNQDGRISGCTQTGMLWGQAFFRGGGGGRGGSPFGGKILNWDRGVTSWRGGS